MVNLKKQYRLKYNDFRLKLILLYHFLYLKIYVKSMMEFWEERQSAVQKVVVVAEEVVVQINLEGLTNAVLVPYVVVEKYVG